MQELEMPDRYHAGSVLGWLELGCREEALRELNQISPANMAHPDVLEVRWTFFAQGNEWDEALNVAEELLQRFPKRASGWLHRAYALRRVPHGGLQMAWDALLPAVDLFPAEAVISYNLACYACQMNQLDEARKRLKRAFTIGGKDRIQRMALADDDLKTLWGEIGGMQD